MTCAKDKAEQQSSPKGNNGLGNLHNRFETLKVEDAEQFFEASAPAVVTNVKKSVNKTATSEDTFELPEDKQAEIAFDVFCFFKDFYNMQEYIMETWKGYKSEQRI